jgi:molybdopterin biosynthesis enzyme MoaB
VVFPADIIIPIAGAVAVQKENEARQMIRDNMPKIENLILEAIGKRPISDFIFQGGQGDGTGDQDGAGGASGVKAQ